jgi:hypothetical protein
MVGQPPFEPAVGPLPPLALAVGAWTAGHVGIFQPPFEVTVGRYLPSFEAAVGAYRHLKWRLESNRCFKRRFVAISVNVEFNYLFS